MLVKKGKKITPKGSYRKDRIVRKAKSNVVPRKLREPKEVNYKGEEIIREKGRLVPGTGNLNPRGAAGSVHKILVNAFHEAIVKECGGKGKDKKNLLEHYIKRAFKSDRVLSDLMKKLVPDLKSLEIFGEVVTNTMPVEEAEIIRSKLHDRITGASKKVKS